ncbi:maleate cis-trans isomerase family protein [Streptomyces tagetis]|uniref:Decarboxylase n=1 Tax=Streptomyces tagetis TaxID=2820809 RepID=A0A941B2F0_9ACTN|nr:decarboxylase [Streptomyces sp. RG38]MBQ0829091.1 decarboxylase [Streptomyces sp. RG38]
MTALGILYPGHSGEDDYPRIEQLLGSNVRVDLVHTEAAGDDGLGADPLRAMGTPARLEADVAELRLAGADALVWASTSGGFLHGHDGAREQIRTLARMAGMPASSTSFAFVHAVKEIGVRRLAVGATYPDDMAALFAEFLRSAGAEIVSVGGTGAGVGESAAWGESELLALVRAADHPDAEAVLVPDNALLTVAHLPALEKHLGKPVLTANQVAVWEALRLADRRLNAPELGALFTREPLVQA